MSSSIGQRIAALRKAKGLTQTQFAEIIDTDRVTVSCYERDQYKPSSDAVSRIAAALGVSTDEILGMEPHLPDPDDEVWQLREELRRDPERRMLFYATRRVRKEDIMTAVRIIDALRGNDDDEAL